MLVGAESENVQFAALRRNRLFESADLDFTRDRISTVLQPHALTSNSRAAQAPELCYLDHIPLARTSIGAIRFGASEVHVPELANYHLFIMCLNGHASATVEGQDYRIDQERGILIAPGEEMLASFSSECEQLFVKIDRDAVADHSGYRDLHFKRNVDLRSPILAPWLNHVATIASDPQTSELFGSIPRIASEYERLLLSFLLAGQTHFDTCARDPGVAPGSVRRAEAFIHAGYAEPLTLSDIAIAAGVPARTLLESFRRFRNTSPIRYLRDVRLDAARETLRSGAALTAADAAMGAGLMHLGRFSQDYATRFGELPSETLRNRRRFL